MKTNLLSLASSLQYCLERIDLTVRHSFVWKTPIGVNSLDVTVAELSGCKRQIEYILGYTAAEEHFGLVPEAFED